MGGLMEAIFLEIAGFSWRVLRRVVYNGLYDDG